MKKKILSLALAVTMLTGCGEKETEDTHKGKIQYLSFNSLYDNGMLYTAGSGDYSIKKYLDFNSLKTTPLCAVPNCTHSPSSSDCLARAVGSYPILMDDSIYYFTVNGIDGGEIIETADGLEFYMESKLMKASLAASETELVCEFNDAIADMGRYLIMDSLIYFIAYDPDPEFDGMGGASWGNAGGYSYLCSIDVKTGEYTNYGCFCYVEDEYPAAGMSSGASIEGYYNGKIMLQYSFLKEYPERDEDGHTVVDEVDFTVYMFEFDPETKEFVKGDMPSSCYINDDCYVSRTQDSDDITVTKGDESCVIKDFHSCNVIANNKVCYNRSEIGGTWCEIGENLVHVIGGEYEDYYIVAYHDGKYVLFNNREAVKLTEEELLAASKIKED